MRSPIPARTQCCCATRCGCRPATTRRRKTLAGEWRRASANETEIVLRAVDFFRRSNIAYTLEPPPLGHDSVDEFLFSTRAGFCEHFASAFVF
jgi:transglutaminase-like putative cysteine protease